MYINTKTLYAIIERDGEQAVIQRAERSMKELIRAGDKTAELIAEASVWLSALRVIYGYGDTQSIVNDRMSDLYVELYNKKQWKK